MEEKQMGRWGRLTRDDERDACSRVTMRKSRIGMWIMGRTISG